MKWHSATTNKKKQHTSSDSIWAPQSPIMWAHESHVTDINTSRHMNKSRHTSQHTNTSCHANERVTSFPATFTKKKAFGTHLQTSHVPHTIGSCPTDEIMRHVASTRNYDTVHIQTRLRHVYTNRWVMAHVRMSHGTHVNETYPTCRALATMTAFGSRASIAMHLCVCVCVRERECVCVRVCKCACVCVWVYRL